MQICFIVKSCLFSVRITSIMADLPQWFNDDFCFWAQKQCEAGKTTEHAKSSTAFGSRYESTPKTATSDRWVSLPTETMQLLRQYRAWQNAERLRLGEYYHDQGFLFAQEDGKPMHPDSITSWLAKFSKRHGLPHINPHAFRHTMASLLYFNGVDSVSISKRLGHAQVSTTCDIYSHVIAEADQRNADILGDIFLKKA